MHALLIGAFIRMGSLSLTILIQSRLSLNAMANEILVFVRFLLLKKPCGFRTGQSGDWRAQNIEMRALTGLNTLLLDKHIMLTYIVL
jgi:hypothetical protein